MFISFVCRYFPKRLLENWGFIKRLIGLPSSPIVKLHYQLCGLFHPDSRGIHRRADLLLYLQVEMQSSAKFNIHPAWKSVSGGVIRSCRVWLGFYFIPTASITQNAVVFSAVFTLFTFLFFFNCPKPHGFISNIQQSAVSVQMWEHEQLIPIIIIYVTAVFPLCPVEFGAVPVWYSPDGDCIYI